MKRDFIFSLALVTVLTTAALPVASYAAPIEPTNLADLLRAKNNKAKNVENKQLATQKAALPQNSKTVAKKAIASRKNNGNKGTGNKKAAVKKTANPYSNYINKYAATYGVPVALAHAVVRHESNFQPNVRGRAGEIGLMQIKLSTARGLGYNGSAKELYDPATNIQYGMKYLAKAHQLGGGSTCGTILKYNAGHGAKRMNPTSAKYCEKVKTYMRNF